MQRINFNKYEVKKEEKSAKYEFQDYCLKVIEDFGVVKPYDLIIWRWAKKNLSYLKGRVEYLREGKTDKEVKSMGALLTWTLKQK